MININNGGSAFPAPIIGVEDHEGMSLRDYFAAKAMQALLSKYGCYEDDTSHPSATKGASENVPDMEQISSYAYAQADAMLSARDK